jgi:hypothetical protein
MASKLFAWAAGLGLAVLVATPAVASPSSPVPFVGCAQDGQQGPQPAPRHPATINVAVDAAAAAKLAYYKATDGGGVLAPRGWHCLGVSGSDGGALYVAPGVIKSSDVLSTSGRWAAGAGPAVEGAWSVGDTSGRFDVAKAIMRLFPAYRSFAQGVIAEGIEPAGDFPSGVFPADRYVMRNDRVVEYETPAGAVGFGTQFSYLTSAAGPIHGVAQLEGDNPPSLARIAVRLPANEQALVPAVVSAFELENGGPPPLAVEPTDDPSASLAVVRAFYTALGRGDGAAASALVIPAKRTGNYAPAALTRFYGSLKQRLQLVSVDTAGGGVVEVHYAYAPAHGPVCNGAAMVRTQTQGGHTLISRIEPANGC